MACQRRWLKSEEKYLSENWVWTPIKDLEKTLRRKYTAIKQRAHILNLPRRRVLGKNCSRFVSPIDGKEYQVHPRRGYLIVITKRTQTPIHRIEMEKILGRPLKPHEKIHHKNGKKDDNRPENLMIYESQKRHAHIDTMRAEIAEKFILEKGFMKEYEVYYENQTSQKLYGYAAESSQH